jgi:ech hydrogenase subunit D
MFETQETIVIEKEKLLSHVQQLQKEGYRLVQISCTVLDYLQVDYSFDKDYKFKNLRIKLPKDDKKLPSISTIYLTGALYENELHDLFDIHVEGMLIDFHGKFYRTVKKYPFLDTQNISVITRDNNKDNKE